MHLQQKEPQPGLPQKKLIENPGLSRTFFLIFQDICFIDSRTFQEFFKKYSGLSRTSSTVMAQTQ